MNENTSIPAGGNHLRQLDSARGIAALMVFGMHFFEKKYFGTPTNTYLTILCNGRDAVSFFFVLSGFVLSYKYIILKKPLDLNKFFVSRFFRLWPAFFVTVVIYCLYIFGARHALTPAKLVDIFILNKEHFWEEAMLLRFHNDYYGAGWTLTIEMVGSLLLPFFILIATKNKKLITYLIFVFIIGSGSNFYYSAHFLLGLLVCCNYPNINREYFRRQKWFRFRYFILLGALLLFPLREIEILSPLGSTLTYLMEYIGIDNFLLSGVASAVFLVVILYSKPVKKILETRVLVFIGKISFGIYLSHLLALYITYNDLPKIIPSNNVHVIVATMISTYFVLTFVFAMLIHYLVELPAIRFGKKITNRMKTSTVIVNG